MKIESDGHDDPKWPLCTSGFRFSEYIYFINVFFRPTSSIFLLLDKLGIKACVKKQ